MPYLDVQKVITLISNKTLNKTNLHAQATTVWDGIKTWDGGANTPPPAVANNFNPKLTRTELQSHRRTLNSDKKIYTNGPIQLKSWDNSWDKVYKATDPYIKVEEKTLLEWQFALGCREQDIIWQGVPSPTGAPNAPEKTFELPLDTSLALVPATSHATHTSFGKPYSSNPKTPSLALLCANILRIYPLSRSPFPVMLLWIGIILLLLSRLI